jgi:hypothetical protein|tara:strand:- start:11228 stop:11338 length:111 start_codon:yes stop_codon:yes gene_type:complete
MVKVESNEAILEALIRNNQKGCTVTRWQSAGFVKLQ